LSQDENASSGGSITQKQNASSLQRNQEANITQMSGTGNNTLTLGQMLNHHQAASGPGPINQTQGTLIGDSGQRGAVSQTTTAPGVNSSSPTQDENQNQDVTTSGTKTQMQIGPQDCCSDQFGGGSGNFNHPIQRNAQQNLTGGASQISTQNGSCNEHGTPGATCTLDQIYCQNGNLCSTFSMSGPAVMSNRSCGGAVEGGCVPVSF
jgi:hypothetical protein